LNAVVMLDFVKLSCWFYR